MQPGRTPRTPTPGRLTTPNVSPMDTMIADYEVQLQMARTLAQDPRYNHSHIVQLFDLFLARHTTVLRAGEPYCTQLLNHFTLNTQPASSYLHNNPTSTPYQLAVPPYPPTQAYATPPPAWPFYGWTPPQAFPPGYPPQFQPASPYHPPPQYSPYPHQSLGNGMNVPPGLPTNTMPAVTPTPPPPVPNHQLARHPTVPPVQPPLIGPPVPLAIGGSQQDDNWSVSDDLTMATEMSTRTHGMRYEHHLYKFDITDGTSLKDSLTTFGERYHCVYGGSVDPGRVRPYSIVFTCLCLHNTNIHLRVKREKEVRGLYTFHCPTNEASDVLAHYQSPPANPPGRSQLESIHSYLTDFLFEILKEKIPLPSPIWLFTQLVTGLNSRASNTYEPDREAQAILRGVGGYFRSQNVQAPTSTQDSPPIKLMSLVKTALQNALPSAHDTNASNLSGAGPFNLVGVGPPNSLHAVREYNLLHTISHFANAHTAQEVEAYSQSIGWPTLDSFIKYWKFNSKSQPLSLPVTDETFVGTDYTAADRQKGLSAIYLMTPIGLYALYKLLSSSTHRHLQVFYLDSVFCFYRSGKIGTCITSLSTVDVDIHGATHITRSDVPVAKAILAVSENSPTSFALAKSFRDTIKRYTGRHISISVCVADLGPGQRHGIKTASPSTRMHPCCEHIRNGPKTKWRKIIKTKTNVHILEADLALVAQAGSDVNQDNALDLCDIKWRGMKEVSFANRIKKLRQTELIGYFHYSATGLIGYPALTNTLERYYLSMKGVHKLNRAGFLDRDVGFTKMLTNSIPQIMEYDAKAIAKLNIGSYSEVLKTKSLPHVTLLAIAGLMGGDDILQVRENIFFCNGPRRLHQAVSMEDYQRRQTELSQRRSLPEDFDTGDLSQYISLTRDFCLLRPIESTYNDGSSNLAHLRALGLNHYCSCKTFFDFLECPASIYLRHSHLGSQAELDAMMATPYSGRNHAIARAGRRRVRDFSNLLNPPPIQGELGLAGDFHNKQLEFITKMTVPTLSQICRLRNLRPATELRRTKHHFVQLIVARTSLGAIIEQAVADVMHPIFPALHGNTGNHQLMPDGTVNTAARHQQLFDPYPVAFDPEYPESCVAYFLSIAEYSRSINGVTLFSAMAACIFMDNHADDDYLVERKLQKLHSHDLQTFLNSGSIQPTDSANTVHTTIETTLSPPGTTHQVLEYVVDGSDEDERATSALEIFEGVSSILDQRSHEHEVKSADLRVGGTLHLTILRYISPDNIYLEEFHLIDPRLTFFYHNGELTKRAKRIVVIGKESLSRFLFRVFLNEFVKRNGSHTITEFQIQVRVHTKLLEEERYGLGFDVVELLEELIGLPVNDVIQRNSELEFNGQLSPTDTPHGTSGDEDMSVENSSSGNNSHHSSNDDSDDVEEDDYDYSSEEDHNDDDDDDNDNDNSNGSGDEAMLNDQPVGPHEVAAEDSYVQLEEVLGNTGALETMETADALVVNETVDTMNTGVDTMNTGEGNENAVGNTAHAVALVREAEELFPHESEEDDTMEAEVDNGGVDGTVPAVLAAEEENDIVVIDLAEEEAWEHYEDVWYPDWDNIFDAEATRTGLFGANAVNASNLPPTGVVMCPLCGDEEAVCVSDSCNHRLCRVCALTLVTTAPFVRELREQRYNMYRTGRCPYCRLPSAWTVGVGGPRIGPRGSEDQLPLIGYIEKNDTTNRRQLYQIPINDPRRWQSLVISTGSSHNREWMLLPNLHIPRQEREAICRTFFDLMDGRSYFHCTVCEIRTPQRCRAKLNICKTECTDFQMCLKCALQRQNRDFAADELRRGHNVANRRFRNFIMVYYRCEPCNGRGRFTRQDGCVLLNPEGWSRPYVDEAIHAINDAVPT